jgi:phage gp46-like protein
MTDMALQLFTDASGRQWSDIAIDDIDVATDDGLQTAVLLSLDLDARNADGKAGFWADALDDHQTGSLLWTLRRSKTTQVVLRQAEDYAGVALQWLIDDGVASNVQAQASRGAHNQLQLNVSITRADGRLYQTVWQAQASNTGVSNGV